jgi:Atypical PilZ domain, cyclic di-GMP receptor
MTDPILGDGLIFEEMMPLEWAEAPLPAGPELARLNADNFQLLGAESSLEEARVHDALKEESPALVHELQRLEYKLNILLRLTADLSVRHSGLPAAQAVRLSSRGLEWLGADPKAGVGQTGLASLYVNPALPQPLKLPCRIAGERQADGRRALQFQFAGVSESVAEAIDKLIFRHHRRLIAGAKHPPG